ncbi:MAG: DUF697 domain-containing protein [bacterium]|nr:DUF697 domain-containing protein [Myxococcales bacterium]MCB9553271.1 DUF697 domain-containing protein [Myxococcales bacterium]
MKTERAKPAETPGAATADAASAAPAADTTRPLPDTAGADAIVRKWTLWSAGFGLIPVPLVDFATTTGFSLKMLHSLSKYYGVPFKADAGKSAISSLLGGAASPLLAMGVGSAAKGIPVVGIPLAVISGPVFAGGITYGIGRVFTAHFGSGGTLFDFDPEKFRDYFQEQIEAGKALIKRRGKDDTNTPSATAA